MKIDVSCLCSLAVGFRIAFWSSYIEAIKKKCQKNLFKYKSRLKEAVNFNPKKS